MTLAIPSTAALGNVRAGELSWAGDASRKAGSRWHVTVDPEPKYGPTDTVCGKKINAMNVTWGERPSVFYDGYVCAKCVSIATDTPLVEVLAHAVTRYATLNYESGWSVIVEAYGPEDLARLIGKATTVNGAIDKAKSVADVWDDRMADARNSAF